MNKEVKPDVPVMQIDDKQYALADLTPTENVFVQHIKDIEDKLRLNEFQHDQLLFGRTGYITALKNSLENPDGSKPE